MTGDYTLKEIQDFVYESMLVSEAWRAEAWRDCEIYDGKQWTDVDLQRAKDAGIDPLTINRVFPVINLLLGSEQINKNDITIEGRTQDDAEISTTMTEAVHYIMEQYSGPSLISRAFKDSVIPGAGFLSVSHNPDPRKEPVWVQYRDWKDMGWDPFGDPWLSPSDCRYVFYQPWKDLDTLIAQFPEKKDELKDAFDAYHDSSRRGGVQSQGSVIDESSLVEEMKERVAINSYGRRRVRPVELWYSTYEEGWWARFPNGDSIELTKDIMADLLKFKEITAAANEVVRARVPKIKTITFLGGIVLNWGYSPYKHDEYPFIPFYGYLDRFNFPYGVPRNLRGQNEEINKRRSMALALLKSRRVTVEEKVVDDATKLQDIYEEANKLDGFIVVKEGKINAVKVEEMAELYRPQVDLLLQSEREIQEVSGANADSLGYKSTQVSGVAIKAKTEQGNTILAPIFGNKRTSEKRLGELIVPEIQSKWRTEKVLRVTDRLTGARKWVLLNKREQGSMGEIVLRNNITQGKFDCVVSEAPATDTVREQHLNMLIEWVKKSPPEIIPYLMNAAMEISNLPNKDQLMARIRPILGIEGEDQNKSPEEIKEQVAQQLEAQKAAQAQASKVEQESLRLKLENLQLLNEKLAAEIESLRAGDRVKRDDAALRGIRAGYDMQKDMIATRTGYNPETAKKAAIGNGYRKAMAAGGAA
jgi:hypothetical protein